MAWRSAWLSGRTDPLCRSSSSSKGHGRGLAIGCSFLLLAGGSLRAWPTPLLRSVLVGALGGRLGVAAAVGGALLGLDPLNGRADSLSISPLGRVAGLRAEGPLRVADLVGVPVVLISAAA